MPILSNVIFFILFCFIIFFSVNNLFFLFFMDMVKVKVAAARIYVSLAVCKKVIQERHLIECYVCKRNRFYGSVLKMSYVRTRSGVQDRFSFFIVIRFLNDIIFFSYFSVWSSKKKVNFKFCFCFECKSTWQSWKNCIKLKWSTSKFINAIVCCVW